MCDAGMLWFGSRDIAAIRGISEEMPWPAAMKAHEKLQFEIVQRKELHLPQYVTVCVLIPGPEFLRGGDATKKFWDLNLLIYLAFMISLLGLSEILEAFESIMLKIEEAALSAEYHPHRKRTCKTCATDTLPTVATGHIYYTYYQYSLAKHHST